MARKKRVSYVTKEGKEIKAKLDEQSNQIAEIVNRLNRQWSDLVNDLQQLDELRSVSKGLYEECDKFFKKNQFEVVSDLTLKIVNKVISDTKVLAKSDAYFADVNPFVSAGDNPEIRDVILILNQVIKTHERIEPRLQTQRDKSLKSHQQAVVVQECISHFFEYDEELSYEETSFGEKRSIWFDHTGHFNPFKCYQMDLNSYFEQ
jgi:hypothetical protein